MDAAQRSHVGTNQLKSSELKPVFKDIGERTPGTIIVLTGGEPLLHQELEAIIENGKESGLRMVLGSNGMLLSEARVKKYGQLGLEGVSISLDSVHQDKHDTFRGISGSFKRACNALEACKRHDMHSQVNFTVKKDNYLELEQITELARQKGASIVNFFFLVCVGRGKNNIDLCSELYEESLVKIAELQERMKGIMIQSRCSPHFKRILYDRNPESPYTRAVGYDGGGCLAGTHYCRIAFNGDVTPCPYMELPAGNIRKQRFWRIWENAALFESLRNPDLLQGKCMQCEYRLLCGGCRARSLAQEGNLMGEDPNCSYVPRGGTVIPLLAGREETEVEWTAEAKARLKRVPLFVRKRVKMKLEERARREGVPVTPELMQKHRKEREEELGMRFG
jgi:radical SAM protein with 4Fe4S-binding SPASM domain